MGKLWYVIHVDLAPGWGKVAFLDLSTPAGGSYSLTLWFREFRVDLDVSSVSLNSGRILS